MLRDAYAQVWDDKEETISGLILRESFWTLGAISLYDVLL